MKCPYCVEEGEKSKVYVPGGGVSTLMGHQDYYDEDGNLHSHDPNWFGSQYHCSQGHSWRVRSRSKCPSCDYGGEKEVRRLDDEDS